MGLRIVFILLLILIAPRAHAIPELGYAATFARRVMPFFAKGTEEAFVGTVGVPIRYAAFLHPRPRGTIVISNGYTETYYKYAEVAYDLYHHGYSVFLFDHRGQGSSGRLIPIQHLGYIDRFDFFVSDLHTFVHGVVKKRAGPAPLFLLAHSMGGAIGARYLETYPADFRAAVLSAPMLGIKLGSWDPGIAKAILRGLEFLGRGASIAIGSEEANPVNQPFEENELTHSPARYRMARQALKDHPATILRAATNSWVLRALRGGEAAVAHAGAVKVPVLVFQAGKDSFVSPAPQEEFCRSAPACSLEKFAEANHEVLMEVDALREPALKRILEFFAAHGR